MHTHGKKCINTNLNIGILNYTLKLVVVHYTWFHNSEDNVTYFKTRTIPSIYYFVSFLFYQIFAS